MPPRFRILAALVLSCLLLLEVVPAHAAGFTLGPGAFVSASDTAPDRNDEKLYWSKVRLSVAPDGTFSAKTRANATNKDPARGSVTVSTYDISIQGEYDAASGAFTGDFTIGREWTHTKRSTDGPNAGQIIFEQTGTGTYSGGLSGRATSDEEVSLTFNGTSKYTTHNTYENGTVEDDGNSFELQHVVAFPVEGVLPVVEKTVRDSGAAFSDIRGQVEILVPTGYDDEGKEIYDEEAWTFAKLDMKLPVGTRIKTSEDSGVILSFGDMTTFEMKPESEIILGDPGAKEDTHVLAGQLWVNLKKLATGQSIDFEGSQAVAGIKGTTFVIKETGSATHLLVIDGTVEFTPKNGGSAITVNAGQQAIATPDGIGAPSAFDVAEESAKWGEPGQDTADGTNRLLWAAGALSAIVAAVAFFVTRRNRPAGA